jgi:hypothetical protein
MKSNSDHYPELTAISNGKTQVRFNITEVTRTDMDGSTRTSYDFDFVEIVGEVLKGKIVEAILISEKPPKPVPVPKPVLVPVIEKPSRAVLEAIVEALTEAKVRIPVIPVK